MNEETVKNRIIIPLFKSMDFNPEEIKYELGFSIKIGHSKIDVGKKPKDRKRGFLDILFLNGNEPLFIVETKPLDHQLTIVDRNQAISYALHLRAPIAIVTNGKEANIYDTMTEKCLNSLELDSIARNGKNVLNINESSYVRNGYKISINEDLKYEALKHLIGYNFENLMVFCEQQVMFRMKNLSGSIDELSKKYIKDLYIKNIKAENEFESFIKSDRVIFALIGEAGVGKTNFICSLAEKLLKKYPVLFFNCTPLPNGILDAIAEDFNWSFPSEKQKIQIIKRLEEIIKSHNLPLFLVLDAIDEWTIPNVEKELNNFVNRIENRNIKLVVSCKNEEWNRFLSISGTPTEFFEKTYAPEDEAMQVTSNIPGIQLNRLYDQEHNEALSKYENSFNFKIQREGTTFEESRLFFVLRAIAEVFKGSNSIIPSDLNSAELLKKYLEMKFSKIGNPSVARNIIKKLGAEIYTSNKIEIEEDNIADKLAIDIGTDEYKALFSYFILQSKSDRFGNRTIYFYFDKLRDFIIAFHSQNWFSLSKTDFKKKIPEVLSKSFGEGLLILYLSEANESQLDAVYDYNINILEECINRYIKLIETEFPSLKNIFYPYDGRIGIVYFVNQTDKSIDGFGFRKINKKHPEKITSFDQNFFDFIFGEKSKRDKIYFDYQISLLKKNYSPITIDPDFESREFMRKQLSEIVKKGNLNETKNQGFATEQAYEIINSKGRDLGLGVRKQDTINEISSFRCEEILEKLDSFRIYKIAKECHINKLKKDGKIEAKTRGGTISYSYSPWEYRDDIKKLFEEMLQKKIPIPDIKIFLPNEFHKLIDVIRIIKKNRSLIGEPICPVGDIKKPLYRIYSDVADYSDKGIVEYVKTFFRNAFKEYKILAEVNFPNIKTKLQLYKSLPVYFFAEISSLQKHTWGNRKLDREINYTFLESDKEFYEIYTNPTKRFERFDLNNNVQTREGIKKAKFIRSSLVSSLLRGDYPYFNTPVRSYVYETLMEELVTLKMIG